MEWLKERRILIFGVFINIFFALKLLKETLRIENFNYFYLIFLFVISVLIYWVYSYALKNNRYRILTTFSILIFLGFWILKNKKEFFKWFTIKIIDNVNHLYSLADKFQVTDFKDYKVFFVLAFICIIPILIAITYKFNNIVILMNFVYITAMWFTGFNEEVKRNLKLYLFITLLTSAIFVYSKRKNNFLSSNVQFRFSFKNLIIYSCIISLIISSIAVVLPQNFIGKNKVDYKSMFKNKFAKQYERSVLDNAKMQSYDLKYSGYSSNDKKLGGKINLDDKVAFEIQGNYEKYIRGSMKDTYTGTIWKRSSKINYRKRNENEDLFFPADNLGNPKRAEMTIVPKELKTTSLMVPPYTYSISDVKGTLYYDNTPVCMSSEIQSEPYKLKYLNTTFENIDEFTKFKINKEYLFNHYLLGHMIYSKEGEKNFEITEYLENEMINYLKNGNIAVMDPSTVKTQYENYLDVPSTVPQRVFDLTYNIIKGCSTNEEKVKNIVNYLNSNYRYYLDVFDVPKGKDFVDYFLFEEKKGYCTYFATATAIMCRIAGVPSRYVEGFKVSKKTEKNMHTNVTNEEAHAWCEILIDPASGIWLIADPSPTPLEYRKKKKKRANVPINIENKKNNNNNIKNKENMQHEDYSKDEEKISLSRKHKIIILIFSIISVIFICNFIFYKIKRKKLTSNKSIIPLYCYTTKRLKSIGIAKEESIGDMEFVQSIDEDELKYNLLMMVNTYYKEHYGNIVDKNFNKNKFLDFLEKYILSKEGKVKYFIKLFFENFKIL